MSNIFKQRTDFVNQPNRTTKDLSFQNNCSFEVGRLTPTLIQEGLPGQSFHIDVAAGIRAMPMVFPIQTPLRFHTYFFKVPMRIMCDEWEDFITGVKPTNPMPYHNFSDSTFRKSFLRTGGLGDFLGIPTSIVSNNLTRRRNIRKLGSSLVLLPDGTYTNEEVQEAKFYTTTMALENYSAWDDSFLDDFVNIDCSSLSDFTAHVDTDFSTNTFVAYQLDPRDLIDSVDKTIYIPAAVAAPVSLVKRMMIAFYKNGVCSPSSFIGNVTASSDGTHYSFSLLDTFVNDLTSAYIQGDMISVFIMPLAVDPSSMGTYNGYDGYYFPIATSYPKPQPKFLNDLYVNVEYLDAVDATDDDFIGSNPFANGDIRLSAFPARAYEMCYNYFFRNEMNDPFLVNGQPEYNKFLPSSAAGADSFAYDFHYRNWELDQFTSSVQSPQFGIAPLVGVTVSPSSSSADLHFGSTSVTNPDGTTTTLPDSTMKVGIDVSTGKINNIVNADGVPSGNLHTLMDAIGYGISINDFRNVNSFQRYLENAIARGYKYRDQMLSHFGVDVGYPDIQVPEMIGAFSCDFNVNQINQMVGTDSSPLGDYAGQGNFIGATQRTISTYCHEHCIIIGISCIVPVPVYTQTLPKIFLRESRFDWFTPEFSKIGYQPIFNKEIAPLQVALKNGSQDGVFGYNRAWYDYLARLDEAHGLFRISLKDFIMMRQFEAIPQLGQNFLQINPEEINDVFAVNGVDLTNNAHDDKFIGLLKFKIITQSPVPSFGQPALE